MLMNSVLYQKRRILYAEEVV